MSLFRLIAPVLAVTAPSIADNVISGTSPWQYQYRPDLLQLPSGADPANGHGLARDEATGFIYYTFQPTKVTPSTQCLVRFQPDGSNAVFLGIPGPSGLSRGVPHGLRIEFDPADNATYLYHANNAALIFKTDLSGNIVWEIDLSSWQHEHPEFWPIKPTQTVVVPGTEVLLVADGYGSSWVHQFDKRSGRYLGLSFGGKGHTSADPIKFNTPHGINVDTRFQADDGGPAFVVSDRSNSRLVWVDASGKYLDSRATTAPPGMSLPCNVDVMKTDAQGDGAVGAVPSLGASYKAFGNGSVAIYSAASEVVSVVEVERLIGHLGHQHPHDAIFLANGDLVVCCWSGPSDGKEFGPALGVISYWERLPERSDIVV